MNSIEDFLLGDTKDNPIKLDEVRISTGFSKDENDMEQKKKHNLRMRQKLMRELYVIESLVHVIFLPFKYGDFDLDAIRVTDVIAKVCQQSYRLITNVAVGYFQNELYVSQWLNLYFYHSMSTSAINNIGAEDAIISLVDNNIKLLEMQISPAIIDKFINLCKA